MKQYLDLTRLVLETGVIKTDRTGIGTRSVFGHQMRYNLETEFPIVKAKYTAFRLVVVELLWLLSGNTNIKFLVDHNCHIWDEWALPDGSLGPVYGEQWRKWKKYSFCSDDKASYIKDGITHFDTTISVTEIDQIQNIISTLKTNQDDRRMIVSAWNVADISKMQLPPCHAFFQFYVANGKLSCHLTQRSADLFLGVSFNIASYALLTHMLAQICGLKVGELIWTGGDIHIYDNHVDQVNEMLSRDLIFEKAQVWLNPNIKDIDDFTIDDIKLLNYVHHKAIKAPVAI